MKDFWELVPANPWQRGPGLLPWPNRSAQLPRGTQTALRSWELGPPNPDYLVSSPFGTALQDGARPSDQQFSQAGPPSGGINSPNRFAQNPQDRYQPIADKWNDTAYADPKRVLDFTLSFPGTSSTPTQAYGPSGAFEFTHPIFAHSFKALTSQRPSDSAEIIPTAFNASSAETAAPPLVEGADVSFMSTHPSQVRNEIASATQSHPNEVEDKSVGDFANAETGFTPDQREALADSYRPILSDVGSYLSNSAEALSRAPAGIAEMARDLVTDPLLFLQRAEPGIAGLGLGVPGRVTANALAEELARIRTAWLSTRARKIHEALGDNIAQKQRTTAALATNGKTIVASGGRDLAPDQLSLLRGGERSAKLPKMHAEITALREAEKAGLLPRAIATTRPMCRHCTAMIELLGGRITSPTTAIFLPGELVR
jgi:hypothetical protein